jgi:hypothetical protein
MKNLGLFAGGIMLIAGGAFTVLCGLAFLVFLLYGPIGWIYDLVLVGPLCCLGIVVFYIGLRLVRFGREEEPEDDSIHNAPQYPPSYLLPAKKGVSMNTQSNQRPNHDARSRYNPITADKIAKPQKDIGSDLAKALSKESRLLGIPFLGLLFLTENLQLVIAPLSLLILFACLQYRLDERMKRIAAVPLAFSTLMLVLQVGFGRGTAVAAAMNGVQPTDASAWGMPFVPLFLSACLFFIPLRESVTFKVIMADACLLLMSGLIPGPGYIAIFYLVHYTLFICVIVAIFSDLKNHGLSSYFSDGEAATQ